MPENIIGSAFVGIRPDVSGFRQALQSGLQSAARGLQLPLPGLEIAAGKLIVPEPAIRNVRTQLQTAFQSATEEWLPGFAASTARVTRQLELPLAEATTKGLAAGVQGVLPLFDRSFLATSRASIAKLGPSIEDLGRKTSDIVGSAVGRGVVSSLSRGLSEVTPSFGALAGHFGTALLERTAEAGAGIYTGLTGVLGRAAGGLGTGLLKGIQAASGAIGSAIETTVKSAGAVAGLGLAVVIGKGLEAGIVAGAMLDRLRATFTAVTGSASVAQEVIASLRNTTIKTSQDFSLLAASAQQLITSGFSPKLATDVINATAQMVTVFGRGIQGFQRASIQLEEIGFKGTVQAQQLNALIRDGVPAYSALTVAAIHLGFAQQGATDATTKAKEAMHAGKITAQAFFEALQDPAVIGNVQKAMEAIQGNIAFQLSQIKTISIHILAQIIEPIQRVFGVALIPITQAFDRLANSSDVLAGIGAKVALVFQPIVPLFAKLGVEAGRFVDTLSRSGGFDQIVASITPLMPLVGALAGLITSLGLSAGAALPLIGGMVPALSPVLAVFVGLGLASPTVRNAIGQVAQTFAAMAKIVASDVAPILKALSGVFGALAISLVPLLNQVIRFLGITLDNLSVAVLSVINGFGPLVIAIATLAANVLGVVLPALELFLSHVIVVAVILGERLGPSLVQTVLSLQPLALALAGLVAALLPLVTAFLPLFTDLMRASVAALGDWAGILGQAAPLVTLVANGVTDIVAQLAPMNSFLGQSAAGFDLLRVAMDATLGIFLAVKVAQIAMAIASGIATIATIAQTVATVALDVALSPLLVPILAVIAVVALLVAGIVLLITHWDLVQRAAGFVLDRLKELGSFIRDQIINHFQNFALVLLILLGPVGLLIVAIVGLITHFNQVKSAVTATLSAVGGAFSAIGATVRNFVTGIATTFTRLNATAEAAWRRFTDHPIFWIGVLIGFVATSLLHLHRLIVDSFDNAVAAAANWATGMILQGTHAAGSFVIAVVNEIQALPGQIGAAFSALGGVVNSWATSFIAAASDAAGRFGNFLLTEMHVLPGQIASAFVAFGGVVNSWATNFVTAASDAANRFGTMLLNELNALPAQMVDVGHRIVQGIIDGIKGMIAAGAGAVGEFVSGLIAGAHKAGQPGSGYRLFAREVGRPIAEGVMLGIAQSTPDAVASMGQFIGALSDTRRLASEGAALNQLRAGPVGATGPITVTINITNPGANAGDIAQELGWALARKGVALA